ncbi:MAG: hypothetical protein FWC78_05860 [Defluviitaleaceae bacterium]|nr:hypothetical protein [Defluviitaleaceae bacterium]
MRVVANELKKIWNVKILAILVVLCTLLFAMSMNDWIRWYPREDWIGNIELAHHLTETYGPNLSLEDFEDFLSYRDVITAELDLFFEANAFFANVGIYSYNGLSAFRQYYGAQFETLTPSQRRLWYDVALELGYIVRTEEYGDLTSENETPDAYNKMISFGNIVGLYQTNIIGEEDWPAHIDSFMATMQLSERETTRLTEIRNSSELNSILPQHTLFYSRRYARGLALLVILVTLILTAPLVTTDRASKVNWLQYSSKEGRSILKKQFAAMLISAMASTTALIIIFAGIFFAATGVHGFWGNGINSFLGGAQFYWLSITFGQYVMLMAGVMYLLGIGTAAFAFMLSRFSQGRMRLLFKVIPLFVATLNLSNWILNDFLAIAIGGDVSAQMFALAISLAMGITATIFTICKENWAELH